MSVVGFDLGNESCVVAVARQIRIDVVLNDESKGATPAIVCFGETQRFLGTAGAASSMKNPKNTISQIKRLIGRQFSDPELQRDLKALPFPVTEGPDGFPLIHVWYLGESRTFTPTQLLAMVLSDMKSIAEKNLNAAVVDCCIGIPVYFTDLQRRAVLDAATIAGLHPLRLLHETTATALAYGIYRTDLQENNQLNVAFVDIGHASMQVCIAGFKKGQLKILAHSFDRSLGGRDFDEALFQYFAANFKEKYKIDVYQNARACLRLRTACEKLKRVLSANLEAPLNMECLMEEKDVRGFIKREDFEKISIPILERVRKPLEKALSEAGLTVKNIHSVEVVGSGSRVPAIIRILTEFFGKEPRCTTNASECVAKGCALECAILSPTFKVREFQVNESFPFPIALSWKGAAPDAQNGVADNQQSTIVYPKGNPIPSIKALTFYRSGTFSVDVQYADVSELQAPAKISSYTIGPFQITKSERAKVKVKVRLNLHGIVSIDTATLLEEEEVEVPVFKEPAKEGNKMDTDEASSDAVPTTESDVNMQDAKGGTDVPGAENGAPDSGDKPVQMETDAKAKAPKKKVKKTIIPVVEHIHGGMCPADVQKATEKEFEMALQDRVMQETKDKKNAVEAYVYDMRNKLHGKYQEFVTDPEREGLTTKLQEVEDWLYEDGEDETKGVYIAKLEELKKQGDPIEERYKEYTERGPVIDQLVYCINSYRDAALSNDPKFNHIDLEEKQKVLNECVEAEAWLREKKQHQDSLPKYATPALLSADVRRKAEALDRVARPIMTKPSHTDPEREGLTAKLQEVEDWLYEDGENKTKGIYVAKLEELKKQGDPIEERYKKSIETDDFQEGQDGVDSGTVERVTESHASTVEPSTSQLEVPLRGLPRNWREGDYLVSYYPDGSAGMRLGAQEEIRLSPQTLFAEVREEHKAILSNIFELWPSTFAHLVGASSISKKLALDSLVSFVEVLENMSLPRATPGDFDSALPGLEALTHFRLEVDWLRKRLDQMASLLELPVARHQLEKVGKEIEEMEEVVRGLKDKKEGLVQRVSELESASSGGFDMSSHAGQGLRGSATTAVSKMGADDFITILKYSPSLHSDFRNSMEEMIEARLNDRGRVDWEFMEELLFCYLDLNEKKSCKRILSNFVNLIVVLREKSGRVPVISQRGPSAGDRRK
ncbi:hypothetical protein RHSIM_Rhsim12G0198100 [Rhododendron simsii]|uniref:OVATE domain-containing protein n=1 Tax=Rhododendron simsii TaxID=118357 RepID=A0A834G503_RHOSS|nr:hypothetical protein RHSIM_Rhsim12G0198100 [Rhododendron simsii]